MTTDNIIFPPACAFTGHRPEKLPWRGNEDDERCAALKEMLAGQIETLAASGIRHFMSGMARGTDIYCSLAVLALREEAKEVKLHCILPCKAQADGWDEASRKLYFSILEQADSIVYVSRDNYNGCMLARNRFLIKYAAVVLAVYNGTYRCGTGATVRYARAQHREIYILDPRSLTLTHEPAPRG